MSATGLSFHLSWEKSSELAASLEFEATLKKYSAASNFTDDTQDSCGLYYKTNYERKFYVQNTVVAI